jgi:predicted RNA-binding Zn-ribbon protein involved in translation (DUF1610 family)
MLLEELVKKGLNNTEIGEILGIHRTTVAKQIKKAGIEREISDTCVICKSKTKSTRKRCDSCNTKIRRYRAKKASVQYLGGKCKKCGWSGNLAGYDFHHLDPEKKDFKPSANELANKSWIKVKEELDKCELLCAICHRLEHNDYENKIFLKIADSESDDLIFKN